MTQQPPDQSPDQPGQGSPPTQPRGGQAFVLARASDKVDIRAVTLPAWLQVFTGDSLPLVARRGGGIAVEPMTCVPDAFSSGDGLLVLEPGQEFAASWGITPG